MKEFFTSFCSAFDGTSITFTYFIIAITLISLLSTFRGDEELMKSNFLLGMTIVMFASATLQLVICSLVNWQIISMMSCLVSNTLVIYLWICNKQRPAQDFIQEDQCSIPDQGIIRPLNPEKSYYNDSEQFDEELRQGRQVFLKTKRA